MTLQELQLWHQEKAKQHRDTAFRLQKQNAPMSKITGFHKTADHHETAVKLLRDASRIVHNALEAA